jgi:hypothetical protein
MKGNSALMKLLVPTQQRVTLVQERSLHVAMENVYPVYGLVMEMMTVETILMRTQIIVPLTSVKNPNSVVGMVVVSLMLGSVIMRMIVGIAQMNKTVIIPSVQMVNSPVITIDVSHKHKCVME